MKLFDKVFIIYIIVMVILLSIIAFNISFQSRNLDRMECLWIVRERVGWGELDSACERVKKCNEISHERLVMLWEDIFDKGDHIFMDDLIEEICSGDEI